MLTLHDLNNLRQKGISIEEFQKQLSYFEHGVSYVNLIRAATVGDGITKLSDAEIEHFKEVFEHRDTAVKLLKFVPASGAASRMFKALYRYMQDYKIGQSTEEYCLETNDNFMLIFEKGLREFPFYEKVKSLLSVSENDSEFLMSFVRILLTEKGLNYGSYPKGVLPFHLYEDEAHSPFIEHFKESLEYATSQDKSRIHFTITEAHLPLFQKEELKVKNSFPILFEKLEISYSYQKSLTDTIAVDQFNQPFRTDEGQLFFRPGGHGALIENLNDINADVVFVKNIDNVQVERDFDLSVSYKKALAGVLLQKQSALFEIAAQLEAAPLSHSELTNLKVEVEQILGKVISIDVNLDLQSAILDSVDRPLRVCGMVKNEGQAGGGPFWVTTQDQKEELQIIESVQIDNSNPEQQQILNSATHFNPVDLVCGLKNHKGIPFDLKEYVDYDQVFISSKSLGEAQIKALELPGLWNGSMAGWNTIFIEVPVLTFNPVKTINDLLKSMHQV
ncbi:MAG: NAD metabolism ATPase/kinase [Flavobacteriaceae bacterium]|nr:NAD metabolism ATPase/kinase [Flavobacteriaceae bacterium]